MPKITVKHIPDETQAILVQSPAPLDKLQQKVSSMTETSLLQIWDRLREERPDYIDPQLGVTCAQLQAAIVTALHVRGYLIQV